MLAAVLSAGMVSCASDDTNNPKEETAETTTLAVETEIDHEQLLYVDLPQLDFGGIAINISKSYAFVNIIVPKRDIVGGNCRIG